MAIAQTMDAGGDYNRNQREQMQGAAPPTAPPPAAPPPASAPSPETPTGAGGSEAPPSSAGDDTPQRRFPVPPVPPPPSPGPIFSLAGGGGGGAASFARPGTEAARPFRSQLFGTNRSTSAPAARFGAGTPVTSGGAAPFLPAGLEGEGQTGAPADELQRILATLRGGGGGL